MGDERPRVGQEYIGSFYYVRLIFVVDLSRVIKVLERRGNPFLVTSDK